jgi:guanylate kinase
MAEHAAEVTSECQNEPIGDTAPASATPTPRKPLLLVLVGIPGSGKSTLSARLRDEGWAVVSQDVLGDRRSCEAATARHLREGRNTVIDR